MTKQLINNEQLVWLIQKQDELNVKYCGEDWQTKFTYGQAKMALITEVGEFLNEIQSDWAWWKKNPAYNRQKAIFELIDVLHFATMMALDYHDVGDLVGHASMIDDIDSGLIRSEDKYHDFSLSVEELLFLAEGDCQYAYLYAITDLLYAGASLIGDLGENTIYETFVIKNQINHARQDHKKENNE